jgi:hypothetical protein
MRNYLFCFVVMDSCVRATKSFIFRRCASNLSAYEYDPLKCRVQVYQIHSEFFHLFLTGILMCGVVKVICGWAATLLILLKSDQNAKGNK